MRGTAAFYDFCVLDEIVNWTNFFLLGFVDFNLTSEVMGMVNITHNNITQKVIESNFACPAL